MSRSKKQPKPGYAVGYARPPVHSRFQPGQCGNPRGRPKGSKNLRTIAEKCAFEPVIIREGKRVRKAAAFEVMLKQAFAKALKQDIRAAAFIVAALGRLGLLGGEMTEESTSRSSAEDETIIREYLERNGEPAAKKPADEDEVAQ
jgi:hypothetical protein